MIWKDRIFTALSSLHTTVLDACGSSECFLHHSKRWSENEEVYCIRWRDVSCLCNEIFTILKSMNGKASSQSTSQESNNTLHLVHYLHRTCVYMYVFAKLFVSTSNENTPKKWRWHLLHSTSLDWLSLAIIQTTLEREICENSDIVCSKIVSSSTLFELSVSCSHFSLFTSPRLVWNSF